MLETIILELLIFLGVFIISGICRFFFNRSSYNSFYSIIGFLGVAIHEICHYIGNLITGIIPFGMGINKTRDGTYWGYVASNIQRSFLQAVLICSAPIYLSTWLIYYLLLLFFNPLTPLVLRLICVLLVISSIIGASPSKPDFQNVPKAFSRDPKYSFFQLGTLGLSFLICFSLFTMYSIETTLTIFYYLCIWIGYLILKYLFSSIYLVYLKLNKNRIVIANKTQNRRSPKKRRKIRRAQW
ncbi:MAG: hypothetical protein P8Y97_08915 [Candidatus Lokiarchaeota archaeon]